MNGHVNGLQAGPGMPDLLPDGVARTSPHALTGLACPELVAVGTFTEQKSAVRPELIGIT